ncbi:hypothetical protein F971_01498 [Acinetobacter vivianii]|uniref:Uncharacterized protein n=1 Tax=Acinetobacter vivianii TaxID=1776742 RepID=N8UY70_9GAMM|nr:hypothetical protein [Acinetobacter vivianii]ENU92516.1 hypothetical protein F971_01498 [Acinetobacter vivianii]
MPILEKAFEFAITLIHDPVFQSFSLFIIGLLLFLFTYDKVKSMGMFTDISSLFRTKKNQLKKLNERLDSDLYSKEEKDVFRHEIKVIEYQILLKTKIKHLQTLIFFNGFIAPNTALKRFNNSSHLVHFDDTQNQLFLVKPISERKAGVLLLLGFISWISALVFGFFFIRMALHNHPPAPEQFYVAVPLITIIFCGFVFLGYIYFKVFSAFNDARLLLKMERKKIEPVSKPENKNEA